MRRRFRLTLAPLDDRLAPSAGLDPTFGDGGVAAVPTPDTADPYAYASDVRVLPDGRAFVLGYFGANTTYLARLTADGRPDPAFHGGRPVVFDSADGPVHVFRFEPLADGRVVVAGSSAGDGPAGRTACVARLAADGAFDPTFDGDGRVTVALSDPATTSEAAAGVAVGADGRVTLLVATVPYSPPPPPWVGPGPRPLAPPPPPPWPTLSLARLRPDGSPDPTLDGDGAVALGRVPMTFTVGRVSALPDGRTVLAGSVLEAEPLGPYEVRIGVARLRPDGSPDPALDGDGFASYPIPEPPFGAAYSFTHVEQVEPGAGGQFLVLTSVSGGFANDTTVTRLTPDGRPDAGFGAGGSVFAVGRPVGVAASGRGAVVATEADRFSPPPGVYPGALVLTRLTPAGRPDPALGPDGRFAWTANPDGVTPYEVALRPDGRVLVVGEQRTAGDGLRPVVEQFAFDEPPRPVFAASAGGRVVSFVAGPGGALTASPPVVPFPDAAVEVRVATADVTGDGVPDLVAGAGAGGGPRVALFDGRTGARLADFFAFESAFTGGVAVAAGDVTGDGFADVIVTPGDGGGPVVAVFDGAGLAAGANAAAERARFLGLDDPAFRGGANAAAGDVNGDGVADLVVAAGPGGGPRVALYDGRSLPSGPVKLAGDFLAFEPAARGGVAVAAGDLDGDGFADVAVGGGRGGGPRVRVLGGAGLAAAADRPALADFFAGDALSRGGVRLAMPDADGDGTADLVAGSGEGEPARVRVYGTATLLSGAGAADREFDAFGGAAAPLGVFVG